MHTAAGREQFLASERVALFRLLAVGDTALLLMTLWGLWLSGEQVDPYLSEFL